MKKCFDTRWITAPIITMTAYLMGVDGWTIALVLVWSFPIKIYYNNK